MLVTHLDLLIILSKEGRCFAAMHDRQPMLANSIVAALPAVVETVNARQKANSSRKMREWFDKPRAENTYLEVALLSLMCRI